MVAIIANDSEKSILEPTALEKLIKLFDHMMWQSFALRLHHLGEGRVMLFNKLIEQCLLWAMALIDALLCDSASLLMQKSVVCLVGLVSKLTRVTEISR